MDGVKAIFKNEIASVVTNKRYIISLALQLLLLSAIIPVFGSVLRGGELKISSSGMQGFIPLAVIDSAENASLLKAALEKNKALEIRYTSESTNSVAERIKSNEIVGMLYIPPSYDESSDKKILRVLFMLDISNLKQDALYDAVLSSVKEASTEIAERRKRNLGIADEVLPPEFEIKIEKHYLKEELKKDLREAAEKNPNFSEFFMSYLVPLMLFFPIFMIGSLVLDSVVGEKEKKTIETLLATPISPTAIVVGKFLAFSFIVLAQILLWLGIFYFYGIALKSAVFIIVFLILINSCVLGTAVILGLYSKSVKEANVMMMMLYTLFFILLIISLTTEYFSPSAFLTPFSIISKLVIGEKISAAGGGIMFLFLSVFSYASLSIASKFAGRDAVVFGPRPGLEEMLEELSSWLYGKSSLSLASVFSMIAFSYAFVAELAIAIVMLASIGYTLLLIPFAAFIEEAAKPLGLRFLAKRKEISLGEGVFLGMLSGAAFFALETLVLVLATYALMPSLLIKIFKLRLYTTSILHVFTSGIVGASIASKKEKYYMIALLEAGIIHTIFNLKAAGLW